MSRVSSSEESPRPGRRQPDLNTVYTINDDGSRNMLQVADVKGRWTTRKYIMYGVLILVYVLAPWVTMGGHPFILVDIRCLDTGSMLSGQAPFLRDHRQSDIDLLDPEFFTVV